MITAFVSKTLASYSVLFDKIGTLKGCYDPFRIFLSLLCNHSVQIHLIFAGYKQRSAASKYINWSSPCIGWHIWPTSECTVCHSGAMDASTITPCTAMSYCNHTWLIHRRILKGTNGVSALCPILHASMEWNFANLGVIQLYPCTLQCSRCRFATMTGRPESAHADSWFLYYWLMTCNNSCVNQEFNLPSSELPHFHGRPDL